MNYQEILTKFKGKSTAQLILCASVGPMLKPDKDIIIKEKLITVFLINIEQKFNKIQQSKIKQHLKVYILTKWNLPQEYKVRLMFKNNNAMQYPYVLKDKLHRLISAKEKKHFNKANTHL